MVLIILVKSAHIGDAMPGDWNMPAIVSVTIYHDLSVWKIDGLAVGLDHAAGYGTAAA